MKQADPVMDALMRIKTALKRAKKRAEQAEERAARAEKRPELLETLIKRTAGTPQKPPSVSGPPPPAALQPLSPPFRVPGINLDLSRAPALLKRSPGEIREQLMRL